MTIHSGHPFAEPDAERDPVRRLRGRLGGAVSLWTTGGGSSEAPAAGRADPGGVPRTGLTVSSVLVAPGEPGRVLGLLDPDSNLVEALARTGTAVVALLAWQHRDLAEAFAGLAPAPGGLFRSGTWHDTAWGPVLEGVSGWAGIRVDADPVVVGWSVLVQGAVEHVELHDEEAPLEHRRGRYARPPGDR